MRRYFVGLVFLPFCGWDGGARADTLDGQAPQLISTSVASAVPPPFTTSFPTPFPTATPPMVTTSFSTAALPVVPTPWSATPQPTDGAFPVEPQLEGEGDPVFYPVSSVDLDPLAMETPYRFEKSAEIPRPEQFCMAVLDGLSRSAVSIYPEADVYAIASLLCFGTYLPQTYFVSSGPTEVDLFPEVQRLLDDIAEIHTESSQAELGQEEMDTQFVLFPPPMPSPPVPTLKAPSVPSVQAVKDAERRVAEMKAEQEKLKTAWTKALAKVSDLSGSYLDAVRMKNAPEIEKIAKNIAVLKNAMTEAELKERLIEAKIASLKRSVLAPAVSMKIRFTAAGIAEGHKVYFEGGYIGTQETVRFGTKEFVVPFATTYSVVMKDGKEVVERRFWVEATISSIRKSKEFKGTMGLNATMLQLNFGEGR